MSGKPRDFEEVADCTVQGTIIKSERTFSKKRKLGWGWGSKQAVDASASLKGNVEE